MRTILRLFLVVMLAPFINGSRSIAQEADTVLPALADVQGVDITMLAWGKVNLQLVSDREIQGLSILSFVRLQIPPGESEPASIREGDEANPAAGVAFVEYGTTTVRDSQGNDESVAAPSVIRDATELRNESLDCTWVLKANHYHRPDQGGGAFTDAQTLMLPSSVPCDQPQTRLGNLTLPDAVPSGPGIMFIAEIEIEPGFNLAGHTENGFIGIAVERGELGVQPDIRTPNMEPENTVYLVEGSDFSIQADAEDGATGLMYGFLRTEANDATDKVATPEALDQRIRHRGFAYSKQRYTEIQ